jgi:quercetin dioxygenase-like cupin family protein
VQVNADGVKFQTKVPTDVSVVTLILDPGATTGWHSHPGLAVIAVAEGTGKLYSADCSARPYSAGEAFVEAGDDTPTVFRNESASPVVLTVTFIAPQGSALSHGAADPGCGLS